MEVRRGHGGKERAWREGEGMGVRRGHGGKERAWR